MGRVAGVARAEDLRGAESPAAAPEGSLVGVAGADVPAIDEVEVGRDPPIVPKPGLWLPPHSSDTSNV